MNRKVLRGEKGWKEWFKCIENLKSHPYLESTPNEYPCIVIWCENVNKCIEYVFVYECEF